MSTTRTTSPAGATAAVRHTNRRTLAVTALTTAALAIAACGSDGGVTANSSVEPTTSEAPTTVAITEAPTTVVVTTEAVTLPPTTAAPETTVAPETTAAPTTEAPTTVPAPTGWQTTELPAGALDGCCEESWTGVPSPPISPDPAVPLADGVYAARVITTPWDPGNPNQLVVDIQRIEQCSVLPEGCYFGPPYAPEDVTSSGIIERQLTLTLDASLEVGLGGWDDTTCGPVAKTATGADLAELFIAFSTDYDAAIGSKLSAGEPEDQVVAELSAAPSNGFTPASQECFAGLFTYQHADAPPLLLQTITSFIDTDNRPPLTPGTTMWAVSLIVTDGQPALYLYAGFFS